MFVLQVFTIVERMVRTKRRTGVTESVGSTFGSYIGTEEGEGRQDVGQTMYCNSVRKKIFAP